MYPVFDGVTDPDQLYETGITYAPVLSTVIDFAVESVHVSTVPPTPALPLSVKTIRSAAQFCAVRFARTFAYVKTAGVNA